MAPQKPKSLPALFKEHGRKIKTLEHLVRERSSSSISSKGDQLFYLRYVLSHPKKLAVAADNALATLKWRENFVRNEELRRKYALDLPFCPVGLLDNGSPVIYVRPSIKILQQGDSDEVLEYLLGERENLFRELTNLSIKAQKLVKCVMLYDADKFSSADLNALRKMQQKHRSQFKTKFPQTTGETVIVNATKVSAVTKKALNAMKGKTRFMDLKRFYLDFQVGVVMRNKIANAGKNIPVPITAGGSDDEMVELPDSSEDESSDDDHMRNAADVVELPESEEIEIPQSEEEVEEEKEEIQSIKTVDDMSNNGVGEAVSSDEMASASSVENESNFSVVDNDNIQIPVTKVDIVNSHVDDHVEPALQKENELLTTTKEFTNALDTSVEQGKMLKDSDDKKQSTAEDDLKDECQNEGGVVSSLTATINKENILNIISRVTGVGSKDEVVSKPLVDEKNSDVVKDDAQTVNEKSPKPTSVHTIKENNATKSPSNEERHRDLDPQPLTATPDSKAINTSSCVIEPKIDKVITEKERLAVKPMLTNFELELESCNSEKSIHDKIKRNTIVGRNGEEISSPDVKKLIEEKEMILKLIEEKEMRISEVKREKRLNGLTKPPINTPTPAGKADSTSRVSFGAFVSEANKVLLDPSDETDKDVGNENMRRLSADKEQEKKLRFISDAKKILAEDDSNGDNKDNIDKADTKVKFINDARKILAEDDIDSVKSQLSLRRQISEKDKPRVIIVPDSDSGEEIDYLQQQLRQLKAKSAERRVKFNLPDIDKSEEARKPNEKIASLRRRRPRKPIKVPDSSEDDMNSSEESEIEIVKMARSFNFAFDSDYETDCFNSDSEDEIEFVRKVVFSEDSSDQDEIEFVHSPGSSSKASENQNQSFKPAIDDAQNTKERIIIVPDSDSDEEYDHGYGGIRSIESVAPVKTRKDKPQNRKKSQRKQKQPTVASEAAQDSNPRPKPQIKRGESNMLGKYFRKSKAKKRLKQAMKVRELGSLKEAIEFAQADLAGTDLLKSAIEVADTLQVAHRKQLEREAGYKHR